MLPFLDAKKNVTLMMERKASTTKEEPPEDQALLTAAEDIRNALKLEGTEGSRRLAEALKNFFTLVDEDEGTGDDLQDQY